MIVKKNKLFPETAEISVVLVVDEYRLIETRVVKETTMLSVVGMIVMKENALNEIGSAVIEIGIGLTEIADLMTDLTDFVVQITEILVTEWQKG